MSVIDLSKVQRGQRINLTKDIPGMTKANVALGWDTSSEDGVEFDLDVSVFLCDANGKALDDKSFIYYNQPKSVCESVEHTGDNRTGEGDGDDETIKVNLATLPETVQKLCFVVTIHEPVQRNQNFGMVNNAYVRLVNPDTNKEELRFDLTEDYSIETSMRVCEIYRKDGSWRFNAQEIGSKENLRDLVKSFGLEA